MNNTEFRRMVLETPRASTEGSSATKRQPSTTYLGSKKQSSIPMTPRTVKGTTNFNFAQQLAARDAASRPQKRFKSSVAPRGTKLAKGYHDRTQDRIEISEDDKAARIQALEEQVKLGQIERETFEELRDNITGGDISATHLVKGLDWKLLERVRKGEDVLGAEKKTESSPNTSGELLPSVNADKELEEIEQMEVTPLERETVAKKGEMAPPPSLIGRKRSRNDILAELRASRQAAQEAAKQAQLGSKFRKIGENRATSRIEKDERGREILITTDEYGKVKRKVRKSTLSENRGLLMPDKKAIPLGMDAPVVTIKMDPRSDENEIDDIFEGVGDSYNPLGQMEDENSDSSTSEEDNDDKPETKDTPSASPSPSLASAVPSAPTNHNSTSAQKVDQNPQTFQKRNYFGDTPATDESPSTADKPFSDPTIIAALKRAAAEREAQTGKDDANAVAPNPAANRLLNTYDRDLEDMDLGFGSSRFGDEEEDEGGASRVRLSEWKGGKDDDAGDGDRGGTKQRKRGKKKRKGDKDNVNDVLGVIESRKKGA